MPTPRQLEIFLAVAKCGSMRAAGDELGISQASISKQVQSIEKKLRGELFKRNRGNKVTLSSLGETIRTDAEKTLRMQQHLSQMARNSPTIPTIRVFLRHFLFSEMESELAQHSLPNSDTELVFEVVDNMKPVGEEVANTENSASIFRSGQMLLAPGVDVSLLRTDSCSLYASPAYIRSFSSPDDMRQNMEIVVPKNGNLLNWVTSQLAQNGFSQDKLTAAHWYPRTILKRVSQGECGAVFLDKHAQASDELERIDMPFDPLFLQFAINSQLPPELVSAVKKHFHGQFGRP